LLAIKNAKDVPENPMLALRDYFGEYKDPSWVDFEKL